MCLQSAAELAHYLDIKIRLFRGRVHTVTQGARLPTASRIPLMPGERSSTNLAARAGSNLVTPRLRLDRISLIWLDKCNDRPSFLCAYLRDISWLHASPALYCVLSTCCICYRWGDLLPSIETAANTQLCFGLGRILPCMRPAKCPKGFLQSLREVSGICRAFTCMRPTKCL